MKAVLVLDEMPKNCNDCMAFTDDPDKHDYCWCRKEDRAISWQWVDNFSSATYCPRPDWCPLKELPKKRNTVSFGKLGEEAEHNGISTQQQAGYNSGWNDCLKEIMGE